MRAAPAAVAGAPALHIAILVLAQAALRAPRKGALRTSIVCQHQHPVRGIMDPYCLPILTALYFQPGAQEGQVHMRTTRDLMGCRKQPCPTRA